LISNLNFDFLFSTDWLPYLILELTGQLTTDLRPTYMLKWAFYRFFLWKYCFQLISQGRKAARCFEVAPLKIDSEVTQKRLVTSEIPPKYLQLHILAQNIDFWNFVPENIKININFVFFFFVHGYNFKLDIETVLATLYIMHLNSQNIEFWRHASQNSSNIHWIKLKGSPKSP